jgi:hypothetical protein
MLLKNAAADGADRILGTENASIMDKRQNPLLLFSAVISGEMWFVRYKAL